jgi:hypothetical protein|tara:strand:- start:1119 stop:1517 length:399 start_codon:yes stop_codon:yes gene_type:complete
MSRSILILAIVLVVWIIKPAQAQNEYLNGGSHCSSHSLEPYMEYRLDEQLYDNSSGNNSRGNNGTLGLRYRYSFGGTCTKEYKEIMLQNERLKQELEMLKMCGKYKDLELGEEFATVREICAGVRKKPATSE